MRPKTLVSTLLICICLWAVYACPVFANEASELSGQIAYVRLTDGFWQVWIYDATAKTSRQLTRSSSDKHLPKWGPDGYVIFRAFNDELYRINADGTAEAAFLSQYWPAVDAVWSPDGTHLVFARFRTDLSDASNLWLTKPDGSDRVVLTRRPGIQFNPSWSPDSRHIVYSAGQGPGTYELYIVAIDGAKEQKLTENETQEFFPAWSPDGHLIAYCSEATGDFEIWRMEADGSNVRQLTRSAGLDTNPAWSPDGAHLAFTTNRRGKLEIWVMEKDGGNQKPLIEGEEDAREPSWR